MLVSSWYEMTHLDQNTGRPVLKNVFSTSAASVTTDQRLVWILPFRA